MRIAGDAESAHTQPPVPDPCREASASGGSAACFKRIRSIWSPALFGFGAFASGRPDADPSILGAVHEVGLAAEIYRIARDAAEARGGGRLEAVTVVVGDLAAVEPDLLDFAWNAVIGGG